MIRQDLPPAMVLAQSVGHDAPRDAAHPGPEILIATKVGESLVGDEQRVLRKIIDGLGSHAERTNERAQPRLFASHLRHEPFGIDVAIHNSLQAYCLHPAGRYKKTGGF